MPAPEASAPQSNPIVAAILQGDAPRPLRLSAARGVLPVARMELLGILVHLLRDPDEQVSREAAARLSSMPDDEILSVLADPSAPAAVLHHFGTDPGRGPSFREAVLANPATPADTLKRMIPALTAAQLDLLLMNQTRLIELPGLLGLIDLNPACTALQRSRVEEIRIHFLGQAPPAESMPALPPGQAPPEAPEEAAQEAPQEAEEPSAAEVVTETEAPVEADNVAQKIMGMNTAEKIQLALKGSREERSILIKDSNKSVQKAVLESPKLSETEVESISKMRSVSDEILRRIPNHRDWMKNYTVVHALATNPKTPPGVAINLIARLNNRDLKIIARDKNVAELIRRQARRVLDSRTERRGRR